MENSVFQTSAVAEELANYVEARLHVDGKEEVHKQEYALHQQMNQTTSRPFYVVFDPATRKALRQFPRGLVLGEDPAPFIAFLRGARGG